MASYASHASYTPFGTSDSEEYHAEQLEKAKAQRKAWKAIQEAEAARFRRDQQLEKAKLDAVKKVAVLEQQVVDLQTRVVQLEAALLSPPAPPAPPAPPPSKPYMICGILY